MPTIDSVRSSTNFLAVSLHDTGWIHWDEKGVLTIRLNKFDLDKEASEKEFIIAATRQFPGKSSSEILRLVHTLQFLTAVAEEGLIIFGISDSGNLEKTGYVDSIKRADTIKLNIEWFEQSSVRKGSRFPVSTDTTFGTILLTPDEYNQIQYQIELEEVADDEREEKFQVLKEAGPKKRIFKPSDFPSLPDFPERTDSPLPPIAGGGGFSEPERGYELFGDIDSEPEESKPEIKLNKRESAFFEKEEVIEYSSKRDQGGEVIVFYGTNRDKKRRKNPEKLFGTRLDDLKLGWLSVNIPPGHRKGKIERPKKIRLQFRPNVRKHIVIKDLLETPEHRFCELFNHQLSIAENEALIFIHGYNNSFAQAAWRTAQIAYDVNFKGVAGFFSWPSAQTPLHYTPDIESADASITEFEYFVRTVIEKTGVEKVHFIAHSMGNRLLTSVIKSLKRDRGFALHLGKIHQLVLAAPDIDQDVFRRAISPYFAGVGIRRTMYASDRDKALKTSKNLRFNKPRLGAGGRLIYVDNGLDTVDASNINPPGFLDHSYVFDSRTVISDLREIIISNTPPDNRGLKPRSINKIPYWMFPE